MWMFARYEMWMTSHVWCWRWVMNGKQTKTNKNKIIISFHFVLQGTATASVCDVTKGIILTSFDLGMSNPNCVAVSSDGCYIVVGSQTSPDVNLIVQTEVSIGFVLISCFVLVGWLVGCLFVLFVLFVCVCVFFCLFVCLFVLFVCLLVCWLVGLFVCLLAFAFVCVFVCLFCLINWLIDWFPSSPLLVILHQSAFTVSRTFHSQDSDGFITSLALNASATVLVADTLVGNVMTLKTKEGKRIGDVKAKWTTTKAGLGLNHQDKVMFSFVCLFLFVLFVFVLFLFCFVCLFLFCFCFVLFCLHQFVFCVLFELNKAGLGLNHQDKVMFCLCLFCLFLFCLFLFVFVFVLFLFSFVCFCLFLFVFVFV